MAGIAKPLYKLMEKDEKWKWSCEERATFENLKIKLSKSPILCLHDLNFYYYWHVTHLNMEWEQ